MSQPAPAPAEPFLRPYGRIFRIIGAHFALFTLARLALYLLHRNDFASLPASTVLLAFVIGLRFDAMIIFTVIGIPMFLLLVPLPLAQKRWAQHLWGWYSYAAFLLFLLLLAVDVGYFGYVHRHIGPEANVVDESVHQIAVLAVRDYLWALLLFLLFCGGLAWGWKKITKPYAAAGRPVARWIFCIAALALMTFASFGTVTGKRTRVVSAFSHLPTAGGYLALNGPFVIFSSWDDDYRIRKVDYYPWNEAVASVQEMLFSPGEQAADADHPLVRKRPAKEGPKPNVVVFMLESWDAWYIDSIRAEYGLPPLGLTPNFDALAKEGVLFTRFYANGQRSQEALSAVFCGFPVYPGIPFLGRGMEQNKLGFLGNLALEEGYETWFIQTQERESLRANEIAPMMGFRNYVAAEDIPTAGPGNGKRLLDGAIWDHEMYREANRRLASARAPYLAYLYTGATHAPFAWPDPSWEKHPNDGHDNQFRNALRYADWALGEFFREAKAREDYSRTIFILTADHIAGGGGVNPDDARTLHHIPCLVIGPGLEPRLDRTVGSHTDLLPTIVDRAGWGAAYSALGRSLFDPTATSRGAVCVEGSLVIRIEDGGWIAHDFSRRVTGDSDAIERRLLAYLQVSLTLLRQNRVHR